MHTSRIARFDTAKTIMMVQVVLLHSITFCPGNNAVKEAARFAILGSAMPLFMFLSGWVTKPMSSMRSLWGLCIVFALFNTIGNIIVCISHGSHFYLFQRAPVMWYLVALMIYRVISHLFAKCRGELLFGASVILSWTGCFLPSDLNCPILGKVLAFLPFFVLGWIVAHDIRLYRLKQWILGGGGDDILRICTGYDFGGWCPFRAI